MDAKTRAEQIRAELSLALADTGVVLDDVQVQQAGRRRLVRVFVARDLAGLAEGDDTSPVEPLSLDEVAEATRNVSSVLDESDVMGEAPYTLEVSSTGLDRPLTTPEHFRRNVGRLVAVHTETGEPVTGRLVRAGTDQLTLHTPQELELPWSEVTKGVVQVEFSRPDTKES